jgi:hypothetical protein
MRGTKINATNVWFFMFLISNIVLMLHNYYFFHDAFLIYYENMWNNLDIFLMNI